MKEQIAGVLASLKEYGVEHADIRVTQLHEEEIETEDQRVQRVTNTYSKGYGVRVYIGGAMGFAGSQDFSEMKKTALKALEIAKAGRLVQLHPVPLAPKPAVLDDYSTPIEIDPFTVGLGEKTDLLFSAERAMRAAEIGLFKTKGVLAFQKETKTYADTAGSYITQTLYESGGGIEAVAAAGGEMQVRSYPGSRGNYATAGYEYVKSLALPEHAARIAHEAVSLLAADECPSGFFDLILDSTQLTLQIHESIGHAVELDRILGHEAAFFGTSFLRPDMIGFEYGSRHVNVVADATVPGGMGTFGYDDDGVKAACVPIITEGKLQNFLSSRDTANRLGQPSNGTSRADGWGRTPLVRMTNINLLPGNESLDQLIAGVKYGFFLEGNKSWSIDDKRLNFQFVSEIAREIADGKLTGRIFKNPLYTGVTPQFWRSCDGVSGKESWRMLGTRVCGKAEPEQTAHVGHGSAPARFRNVKVGVRHGK